MGFFSWKTSDTDKPIRNKYTKNGPTACKMVVPTLEFIERSYEGYGIFAGEDYYSWVDKLNGGDGDRDRGIELDFSGQDIHRPKLVSIECDIPWKDLPDSEIAECQGYW